MVFGLFIGGLLGVFLRHVRRGAALFTVMVCVVVAEIGARISLDPLIVMLAAGVWLENGSKADAHHLLRDFEAAQLPVFLVFFALAGAHIDLDSLYASLIPILVLVGDARGQLLHRLPGRDRLDRHGADGQAAGVARPHPAGRPRARARAHHPEVVRVRAAGDRALARRRRDQRAARPVILRTVLVRTGEAGKRVRSDFASGS